MPGKDCGSKKSLFLLCLQQVPLATAPTHITTTSALAKQVNIHCTHRPPFNATPSNVTPFSVCIDVILHSRIENNP